MQWNVLVKKTADSRPMEWQRTEDRISKMAPLCMTPVN